MLECERLASLITYYIELRSGYRVSLRQNLQSRFAVTQKIARDIAEGPGFDPPRDRKSFAWFCTIADTFAASMAAERHDGAP